MGGQGKGDDPHSPAVPICYGGHLSASRPGFLPMRMRITLPVLAALFMSGTAVADELPFQVPYSKFHEGLQKVQPRPNTELLTVRTTMRPKADGADEGPLAMQVVTADGTVIPVPVGEDNAFAMPFNPAWVEEGAIVRMNQDPNRFEMRVQIGMKLPEETRFTYADMLAAFAQVDGVIAKEAGLLAFAVPSAKTLRVQCGTDCTATLATPQGEQVVHADAQGRVVLTRDRRLQRQNPTITLSHPARYTVISTRS